MSYAAAIDSLVTRLSALVPTWEPDASFYTLEDGDGGAAVDVERAPDDVIRLFDIRMRSLPGDDNGSGYPLTRWRVELELRVRYPVRIDRARLERMMAADVVQLVNGLIHPALPSPWHSSIDSVEPPGAPSLSPLTSPEGALVAHLVTLPFTMLYTVTPEV